MALIKCPECGQEISSSANHCVHCGYSFVICPDCNAVLEGKTTTCPQCGCKLKPDLKPQTAKTGQQTAAESNAMVSDAWDKRFAEQKRKEKIFFRIKWLLAAVMAIIVIVAFVSYYRWTGKNAYGRFSSYKSLQSTMHISIIFACIMSGINAVVNALSGSLLPYLCLKKIRREKWNIKAYVKKHSADVTSAAAKKTYGACLTAAYWEDNPKACRLEFVKTVLSVILGIVTVTCVGVFFVRFMDVMIKSGLTNSAIKLGDYDYRPIIAAAVFGILDIINMFVIYSVNSKGLDEWMENVKK